MLFPTKQNQELVNEILAYLLNIVPRDWGEIHLVATSNGKSHQWEGHALQQNESRTKVDLKLTNNIIESADRLYLQAREYTPIARIKYFSNGRYALEYANVALGNVDQLAVEQAIDELRALALETCDIDSIKQRVSKIAKGYSVVVPRIPSGQKIFRGVIHKQKPDLCSSVSYAPAHVLRSFHRAGRPGLPLFYCSTDRNAVFYELRANPDDRLVLGEWVSTEELLLNNCGYHGSVLALHDSNRELPFWAEAAKRHNEKNVFSNIVAKFLAEEFARYVPPGQEYLYKVSAAIAEFHFQHDMFDGLLYPALAFKAHADNLCLKPVTVDTKLVLKKVEYYQVTAHKDNAYEIKLLDFADTFVDGQIQWKGRPPRWQMKNRGDMLALTAENGKWVARDNKGNVVEPD